MAIEITPTAGTIVYGAEGTERILQRVRIILATPRGSLPLDRNFGITWELLDQPTPRAAARLRAEIADQLTRFEPEMALKAINMDVDQATGKVMPRVQIDVLGG